MIGPDPFPHMDTKKKPHVHSRKCPDSGYACSGDAPFRRSSPTPWKVGNLNTVWTGDLREMICEQAHDTTADVQAGNAALIVRSVNSHADLLDACINALKDYESGDDISDDDLEVTAVQLREAIAKAQEVA